MSTATAVISIRADALAGTFGAEVFLAALACVVSLAVVAWWW